IRELLGGQVGLFLQEAGETSVFGGVQRLLAEQVERAVAEQRILRWLAVEREPVSIGQLAAERGTGCVGEVMEAVEAFRRRSLVERSETPGTARFTLQSVMIEYMTDRLVETAANEITHGQPVLLLEQPLIKRRRKTTCARRRSGLSVRRSCS